MKGLRFGLLCVSMLAVIAGPAAAQDVQVTYEYDALGRVTKVTSGAQITTYSYDKAGNRTSQTVTGGKPPPVVVLPLLGGLVIPLR